MSLKAKLAEDLKDAMRAKDQLRLDTIRSIRGAITQREVDAKTELDDAQIAELIRGLRKQRTESIEQYAAGGRDDLVNKEKEEKAILEAYLPAAPDAAAIESVVKAVIAELSASSIKDMGRVMTAAKEKLPGADGKELSAVVRRLLN